MWKRLFTLPASTDLAAVALAGLMLCPASFARANSFAQPAPPGVDSIPAAQAEASVIAAPRVSVSNARAELVPAPVPDPDVATPRDQVAIGPGLAPAFFREKTNFQGAGFAPASNLDHAQNERRAPVPGLSWTVPVK